MSSKRGGLQISTIIIVLIALFYTAKVYWYKEELKNLFGGKESENFEVTSLSTSFRIIDQVKSRSLLPNSEERISYDVPCIHIKAKINNLTGDNIEEAELTPELNVVFKYGEKTYLLLKDRLFFGVWKAGETITIDDDFYLTNDKSFDVKILKHIPERVNLNLYLEASNSVGLNLNSRIYSETINSWSVNY